MAGSSVHPESITKSQEREGKEHPRVAMPKSIFLRKKNKKGDTADFKRPKAKVGYYLRSMFMQSSSKGCPIF